MAAYSCHGTNIVDVLVADALSPANAITLPLFEIALVLVRVDHVASHIQNANHGIM